MYRYLHTQVGYVILGSLALILLIGVSIALAEGVPRAGVVVLAVVVLILALFYSLNVRIDEEVIEIRFGPGIIRKSFRLKDIESCRTVKNHWSHGWGIHMVPGGWLYNVSGWYAVEIVLRGGQKHRIGTDVPDDLCRAISDAVDETRG